VLFADANIEGVGLVDNVREPGGNITGVRYPGPDLAVKRFDILHEIAPKAKRMWVPYLKDYPAVNLQLQALQPVAAAAGVTLWETPVDTPADILAALRPHDRANDIDAILQLAEPVSVISDDFVVFGKYAAAHKLPVGGALVTAGNCSSIFGISTDNVAVGRQAAPLADKILQGTPAGAIPVASAENYIQINYIATQALGLQVSEGLLSQANQVIH